MAAGSVQPSFGQAEPPRQLCAPGMAQAPSAGVNHIQPLENQPQKEKNNIFYAQSCAQGEFTGSGVRGSEMGEVWLKVGLEM